MSKPNALRSTANNCLPTRWGMLRSNLFTMFAKFALRPVNYSCTSNYFYHSSELCLLAVHSSWEHNEVWHVNWSLTEVITKLIINCAKICIRSDRGSVDFFIVTAAVFPVDKMFHSHTECGTMKVWNLTCFEHLTKLSAQFFSLLNVHQIPNGAC